MALVFYRARWRLAAFVMLATMLVDLDHLAATPVYDPARCSIGTHPLHSLPMIALYAGLFALPLLVREREHHPRPAWLTTLHLAGLGLLIHMALDGSDCIL